MRVKEDPFKPQLSGELGTPEQRQKIGNGRLLVYDQFPSCYASLQEMTDQFQMISAMGFNVVLLNPLHPRGQQEVTRTLKHYRDYNPRRVRLNVKGSLYAILNHDLLDSRFAGEDKAAQTHALQIYTAQAHAHGLIPMFDLVLNQVASDHPMVTAVQTSHWFKERSHFNDCKMFDYEQHGDEIVSQFWEPYIRRHIEIHGFRGVRIDAAKLLPKPILTRLCQFIYELTCDTHAVFPMILGEILDQDSLRYTKQCIHTQMTHITDPVLYDINIWKTESSRSTLSWNTAHETMNIMGKFTAALHEYDPVGGEKVCGGSVGYAGSYDTRPLLLSIGNEYARQCLGFSDGGLRKHQYPKLYSTMNTYLFGEDADKADHLVRMKMKLLMCTFTATGGWMLLCGDEYGHAELKSVFDFYQAESFAALRAESGYDLCDFIKEMNAGLALLPPVDPGGWCQQIVLPDRAELFIIIKYAKAGSQGPAHVIVANVLDQEQPLCQEDYQNIVKISLSLEEDVGFRGQLAHLLSSDGAHIIIVGEFALDADLVPDVKNSASGVGASPGQ